MATIMVVEDNELSRDALSQRSDQGPSVLYNTQANCLGSLCVTLSATFVTFATVKMDKNIPSAYIRNMGIAW